MKIIWRDSFGSNAEFRKKLFDYAIGMGDLWLRISQRVSVLSHGDFMAQYLGGNSLSFLDSAGGIDSPCVLLIVPVLQTKAEKWTINKNVTDIEFVYYRLIG